MRHRNTIIKLGRTSAHKKALLANLSASLIEHKHLITTEAKAKAARRFVERLITLAKTGTLNARRVVLQRLRQRDAVQTLFEDVAPRFKDRNGGYTRVVKLGRRSGDAAPMAVVELIGFETAVKKQKDKQAKAEAKKKKEEKKASERAAEAAKEAKAEKDKKGKKEEKKAESKEKAKDKDKKAVDEKAKKDSKKGKKEK
jgi:large subunit ribosomal protein L17